MLLQNMYRSQNLVIIVKISMKTFFLSLHQRSESNFRIICKSEADVLVVRRHFGKYFAFFQKIDITVMFVCLSMKLTSS